MKSSVKNIKLNSVDDLFSTEESRQDANREKVMEIPLVELYPFKHHPFKVVDDERMLDTADSIREYHSDTYAVFATLNMRESDWDAAKADFSSDADFLSFVYRAQALSFYDTGIEVGTDDQILTLITCDRDYHSENGRLIVMAVRQ